nr:hypothetical protein [Tanacetum cinerariifolium]
VVRAVVGGGGDDVVMILGGVGCDGSDGGEEIWRWRLWSGEGRGGACYSGSSRSGDKNCLWFRPEGSLEKFFGGGGDRRRLVAAENI